MAQTAPVLSIGESLVSREKWPAHMRALWGETARVIAMQAGPILASACLGFAGATILANLVSVVMSLSVTDSLNSFFNAYPRIFTLELVLEGSLGLFALLVGRAMIAWVALHARAGKHVRLGSVLRAAWKRLPALLISAILYGVVICLGLAGVTLLLRELRLDVSSFVRVDSEIDYAARTVVTRAIGVLIPDPGAPFSQIITYGRYLLYRADISRLARSAFFYIDDAPQLPLYVAGAIGAIAILFGETLLRLRTVGIMASPSVRALSGLWQSVNLGREFFGFITVSAWILRLAVVVTTILFIVLPSTMAQTWLVPNLSRQVDDVWPYPVSNFLFACAGALVSVILGAFEVVYDTRIYLAVTDRLA